MPGKTQQVASPPKPPGGPALLFDLDGTLVDSVYQHVLAWNEALQEKGIEYPNWSVHRRVGMSGTLFLQELLRELRLSTKSAKLKQIQERKKDIFMKRLAHIQILPGARALLKRLSELNVPWAVATSGGKKEVEPLLKLLHLPSEAMIITGDEVAEAKPEPDIFMLTADRLRVSIDNAVIVGDSVWDILAARRAKALGVGLLSGGYGHSELEAAGAYRVYRDPAELLEHLEELGIHNHDS